MRACLPLHPPQGYHKTDKMGRPVYIQHLGKIDIVTIKQITTEDRMIKYHIQEWERCIKQILPVCSKLQARSIDQTFGIMDVKGARRGTCPGAPCCCVAAGCGHWGGWARQVKWQAGRQAGRGGTTPHAPGWR
jgi:hypothetical protein